MQTPIETSPGSVAEKPMLRQAGVDFDLVDSRSTLTEMIQLGGLFPISRIVDRLPYTVGALRRLARNGPFSDCFMPAHTGNNGDATPALIHLDRFSERFQALAQQAREDDERAFLAEIAACLDKPGIPAIWNHRA